VAEEKKAITLKERLELQRVEEGDEAIEEEGTASTCSGASSSDSASRLGDSGGADDTEDLGGDGSSAAGVEGMQVGYRSSKRKRNHTVAVGGHAQQAAAGPSKQKLGSGAVGITAKRRCSKKVVKPLPPVPLLVPKVRQVGQRR